MLRPFYIVLLLLVAVFFKFCFVNIVLLTGIPDVGKVSDQPIFKIGKKRRCLLTAFSENPPLSAEESMLVGEKEENDDTKKHYKKAGFSFRIFLLQRAQSPVESGSNGPGNPGISPLPINLKPYLAVSSLRI
jgi:hypothetical protein